MTFPRNGVPNRRGAPINQFNKAIEDDNLTAASEHLLNPQSLYNGRAPINPIHLTKWARDVHFDNDEDYENHVISVLQVISTLESTDQLDTILKAIGRGMGQRPNRQEISGLIANKIKSGEQELSDDIWLEILKNLAARDVVNTRVVAGRDTRPTAAPAQASAAAAGRGEDEEKGR